MLGAFITYLVYGLAGINYVFALIISMVAMGGLGIVRKAYLGI
jgi:hypothetical protein